MLSAEDTAKIAKYDQLMGVLYGQPLKGDAMPQRGSENLAVCHTLVTPYSIQRGIYVYYV